MIVNTKVRSPKGMWISYESGYPKIELRVYSEALQ